MGQVIVTEFIGRITYEGFARAWPSMEAGDFGEKMNGMPKYIVSSTLTNPTWNNTTVIGGDLVAEGEEIPLTLLESRPTGECVLVAYAKRES